MWPIELFAHDPGPGHARGVVGWSGGPYCLLGGSSHLAKIGEHGCVSAAARDLCHRCSLIPEVLHHAWCWMPAFVAMSELSGWYMVHSGRRRGARDDPDQTEGEMMEGSRVTCPSQNSTNISQVMNSESLITTTKSRYDGQHLRSWYLQRPLKAYMASTSRSQND